MAYLLLHECETCGAVVHAKHICLELLGDLGKVWVIDACYRWDNPPARLKPTLDTNDGPAAHVLRNQRGTGSTTVDCSADAVYNNFRLKLDHSKHRTFWR